MTIGDHLVDAAAAHAADVDALADMDEDQLDFLGRVHELDDPVTDGLECDHENRA